MKIIIPADSPEVLLVKASEEKEYKVSDYTDQQRLVYQKMLKDKGFEVPRNKAKTAEYRSKYTVRKGWYETDQNGNQVLKANYFWKEDADPVLKEAYDWLMGYYRSRDKGVVKYGKLEKQDIPDLHFKTPSGILVPEALFAKDDDARKIILNMLRCMVERALEIYPHIQWSGSTDPQMISGRLQIRCLKIFQGRMSFSAERWNN